MRIAIVYAALQWGKGTGATQLGLAKQLRDGQILNLLGD